MFTDMFKSKIDKMFDDLGTKAAEVIENSASITDAVENVARVIGAETAMRSKTMLSSMYSALSERVLSSISEVENRNKFYRADLQTELMNKYSFKVPRDKIDFKEANRVTASLAVGAGTTVVGGLLVFALSPSAPIVPIAIVVAVSVCAFCVMYFKITPNVNKSNFKEAVKNYLGEVKESYTNWLDEAEKYFNKRTEEIKISFVLVK